MGPRFIRGERLESGVAVADGEAGRGVYFCLSNSPAMVRYYTKDARRIVEAVPKMECSIVDLTKPEIKKRMIQFLNEEVNRVDEAMGKNHVTTRVTRMNYQRYGRIIELFIIIHYPGVAAYFADHFGPGIPKGKQLVVRDLSKFDLTDVKRDS